MNLGGCRRGSFPLFRCDMSRLMPSKKETLSRKEREEIDDALRALVEVCGGEGRKQASKGCLSVDTPPTIHRILATPEKRRVRVCPS